MAKRNQIVTRSISILMFCGVVLFGVYEPNWCIADFDNSVIVKPDSIFEIDGHIFFVHHDGIYDEHGNLTIGIVDNDENISQNEQSHLSFNEILGVEEDNYDEFSSSILNRDEMQKLYFQSVINSMKSSRKIEVSRWITSGDWSHDNDDMTITIH